MSHPSPSVEQLFNAALARPAPERGAFLDRACADRPNLRARLDRLIAAHDSPEEPLAAPVFTLIPEEKPDDVIGRYRLVQKLGEGGCGVVWMAEQQEPVRRQVAVKVIKLGMDTREVIARFEAERQALAILEHPNIAKVYDAGATETGRPYFVMELVRGVPITKHCDEHCLDPRARLQLFIKVCAAVQHAHQKGIIHRDLKPSNILVAVDQDGAVPKVIDFGIAKATQGPLTDHTVVTAVEQFLGTPAYMSPEQAAATMDIDTRTDVYSLGVLLYELLVGRPPFDPRTLGRAGRDEIRRIIQEVDPARPSTQFNTLQGDDRTAIARRRGTAPERLSVLLRGDLDWIVIKALEKNRLRRYETPIALADDLMRHLQHQPVIARPPTVLYRTRKLVRRHRVAVAAAGAVAVALLAGTAVATWQAVQAARARDLAVAQGQRANELLDFILRDLRKPLRRVGQLGVLDTVAAKALGHFRSLDPREMDEATLTNNVSALTALGLVRVDQARYAEAAKIFAEADARSQRLLALNPRNAEALLARGQAEWCNGFLPYRDGRIDVARPWFLRYRRTALALVDLDPAEPRWQAELARAEHNLSALEKDYGDPATARQGFRAELGALQRVLAVTPADTDLRATMADATSFLGSLAEMAGDLAEAAQRYAELTVQFGALRELEPDDTHWRFKYASSRLFQGALASAMGQRRAAREHFDEARKWLDALVARDPTSRRWRTSRLVLDLKEAPLARAEGNLARAATCAAAALAAAEQLAAQAPSDADLQYRLAIALRLAAELPPSRPAGEAVPLLARAMTISDKLLGQPAAKHAHRAERAEADLAAGRIAAAAGDANAARRHWQHGAELLAPHIAATNDWRVLDPAARVADLLGRPAEARPLIKRLEGFGYVPLEPWPSAAGIPSR